MSELEHQHKWHTGTPGIGRSIVADLLIRASATLAALAARLAIESDAPRSEAMIEFHADAGAPEGALYVDGKLVGWIRGINRL